VEAFSSLRRAVGVEDYSKTIPFRGNVGEINPVKSDQGNAPQRRGGALDPPRALPAAYFFLRPLALTPLWLALTKPELLVDLTELMFADAMPPCFS